MEKFTFYIDWPEGNDEQKRLYALLDMLKMSFGLSFRAVSLVETDKAFLVPMLKELGGKSQEKVAEAVKVAMPETVEDDMEFEFETVPEKTCLLCGKVYRQGGIKGFCSKRCYNIDYGKRHKAEKKPGKRSALPNQAKIDENRNEEEARIEAVVAKAKMTAPSANTEHKVSSGGAINGAEAIRR